MRWAWGFSLSKNTFDEPKINEKDRNKWRAWKYSCTAWSETARFNRRVENAKYHIRRMHNRCPDAYVGWSAGKDSTVLAHLALAECDCASHAMSIKDDLDYPGEKEYVQRLAKQWGVEVDILTPDFSLIDKLKNMDIDYRDQLHGRNSVFSDQSFYSLVKEYRIKHGTPGVYLGLRADESSGRAGNASRGAIYEKKSGEVVCQPLRNFSDKDIYAYMFSRDIPFHPVYKCLRFLDDPTKIRKSWWVSGFSNRYFDWPQWLRAHWPSLYKKHREIFG